MARSGWPLITGTVVTALAAVAALLWVDSRVGALVVNSAWLIAGVELLALPAGLLWAVAIAKTDAPGARLAWLAAIAAIFVPLYVVAAAWDAGFGLQGWHTLVTNPQLAREPWLAGWRGACWVHAMAATPWVALIVAAGLRAVDAELEEDALLRMPAHQVFMRVTLRRVGGAIAVAAVWVAMVTSTEIVVTDLFQVRTFAEEVYTQAALGALDFSESQSGAEAPFSPLGLLAGIALSAALALVGLLAGRRFYDDLVHAPHQRPWRWRLRGGRWPAAALLWALILLVIGLPLANLAYKAGVEVTATDMGRVRSWSAVKTVSQIAAAPWEYREELLHSAALGAAAATAALAIAVPLAWSMRRSRRAPWLRLGLLAGLMAVPGPLLGVGLIRLLNRPVDSPLEFLAVLYDSDFAPWLAQTLRAVPLVTLVLWPMLASVPQAMLDAAATDGAGRWRRFFLIALPQRWPAIAVAWLVGLAVALGELAATVLVVPPGPTTISIRVFSLIHYGVDDRVAAICLTLVLTLAVLAAIAARLLGRRLD